MELNLTEITRQEQIAKAAAERQAKLSVLQDRYEAFVSLDAAAKNASQAIANREAKEAKHEEFREQGRKFGDLEPFDKVPFVKAIEKKNVALTDMVELMIQHAGYDGPTERLIAAKKIYQNQPELYQAFVQRSREETAAWNKAQDALDAAKQVTSIQAEGKGITGDQSPGQQTGAAI